MNFDVKFSTNSQKFKTTLGTGEKSFKSGMQIDNTVGVPVVHDDHTLLTNRDAADQHPMSAITGLTEALAGKDALGAAAGVQSALNTHMLDGTAHITAAERETWNKKVVEAAALQSNIDAHAGNTTIHVTASDKKAWNGKEDAGTAETAVTAHNTDAEAHSDIREAITEKISQADLQSGIDAALAQAKASGEFDGKDGAQGIQGEKGTDGKDGADGHSPVVTASKNGTTTTISVDGAAIATINDGEKGADGAQGKDGATGADGKTPVKGTDYWTDADKSEIVADAKEAIDLSSYAEKTELENYLPLTGGTCTGGVTAPSFQTGTDNAAYFQTKKMRGEGNADTYYHAVDWGYANHDVVDFHEYGGIWRFFKNTGGKSNSGTLVGSIQSNGWNGGAALTGTPTAPTAAAGTNTTQIATTEFVQTALAGVDTSGTADSAVSTHNTDTSAHSDIRAAIPTKTSQITNDSGYITAADVPEGAAASNTTPKMDGTAAAGSETAFARGDHVHPTDTSRASASDLTSHMGDTTAHITAAERTAWNAKESGGAAAAVQSNLDTHAANTTLHITADERTAWNAKEAGGAAAAVQSNLDTHTADTTAHVTADERTAWNAKQAAITGAASTIATSDLTASRVMVTNTSGKAAASSITTTKLGYLSGVTSSIQTQLNAKLPKTGGTLTGGLTMDTNNAITFTNGDGNSTADMFNLNDMFAHGEGVGILTSGQGGNLTYLDVVDGGIYIGDDCDNNIQIHGVKTPAADADAANKSYVDTAVSGVSSSVTELSKKVSSKGDMFRDVYDPDKDGCVLDADNAKKLKTAVDITVGSKTNSFNGSSGISFTLADIGAAASSALTSHTGDTTVHITAAERTAWNAKADASKYLPLTGGTIAGGLVTDSNNGYIDLGGEGYLDMASSVFESVTGGLLSDANGNANIVATEGGYVFVGDDSANPIQIKNVATPTEDNDAANKAYVDASKPTTTTISLSTTWTGSASPYTQTVTVSGGTSTCKVDLQPDATAFAHMVSVGCNALFIVNNSGTFTAYAIGAKTTTALSIQATVTEVS